LAEKADLDRLTDLDSLSLLHEYLSGILAPIPTIKTGNTVLLRVVSFFEGLECGHQIMSTRNTMGNHSFCDTCCHGALDNRSDGVHWSDDFGLILRRYVQLDLLEEILRCAEPTYYEHVLQLG
jgi:hypothetical protein